MAEGRVVAEIESQAGRVDEDELPGNAELEIPLVGTHLLGHLRQLGERLLHGAVLERVELDRPESAMKRNHEIASTAPDPRAGLAFAAPAVPRRRSGAAHAGARRIARLTALRTMTSFSDAARLSESIAFCEPIFPSAIAAQALIS